MPRHTWIMLLALISLACTYETNHYVECTEDGDCTMGDESKSGKGKILNAWSQSGFLFPGSENLEVRMQAHFEDPWDYTVQFGVHDPNVAVPEPFFVRTRAEIVWSVRGNNLRRVVDVINGTSVTGTAEAVSVKVFDDSHTGVGWPITFGGVNNGLQYNVSVQVTQGIRPAIEQPPYFTSDAFIIGGAPGPTFAVVPVPIEAGAVSAYVTIAPSVAGTGPLIAGTVLVEQRVDVGSTVLKKYDPNPADWVPLASGCKVLTIIAAGGAPSVFGSVAFGIDG